MCMNLYLHSNKNINGSKANHISYARFCLVLISANKKNLSSLIKMLERVWRKGNPLTLLVGMQTSTATMENSVGIP